MKTNLAKTTAIILNCSESMVRRVLTAKRNPQTILGQEIIKTHKRVIRAHKNGEKRKEVAINKIALNSNL